MQPIATASTDDKEMGPREQLEKDKAKSNYYREESTLGYALTDAKGRVLNDENDPLLARLEAGLR